MKNLIINLSIVAIVVAIAGLLYWCENRPPSCYRSAFDSFVRTHNRYPDRTEQHLMAQKCAVNH